MAQVHRAKILIDGRSQDVVVRFIKPGIADRVQEDDQDATIARQKTAKSVYEKEVLLKSPKYKTNLQFHVPRVYESAGKSKLMVQEMIFGRKLDKEAEIFAEGVPGLKKKICGRGDGENVGG